MSDDRQPDAARPHPSPPDRAAQPATGGIRVAAFGTWRSPLSAGDVASASVRIGGLAVSGTSVFWGERRPREGGRTAVIEWHGGERHERLPAPWNVRSRAHEYGGGAFTARGRELFFCHFDDGRVYVQSPGGEPIALTPESRGATTAYADLLVDGARQRLIAVCERSGSGEREPVASLVAISLAPLLGGNVDVVELARGEDFYASPCLDPEGRQMAWITWSHPDMPWDHTRLWLAEITDEGGLGPARLVAGSERQSIFQPGFLHADHGSPAPWGERGDLVFVSDRSGWWNLERIPRRALLRRGRGEGAEPDRAGIEAVPLAPDAAEYGRPQWIFGMTTWCEAAAGLYAARTRDGVWSVGRVDGAAGAFRALELPFTVVEELHGGAPTRGAAGPADAESTQGTQGTQGSLYACAATPRDAARLVEIELSGEDGATATWHTLNDAPAAPLPPESVSVGEPISFPSASGRTAHAFFYRPRLAGWNGPPGELPPLIVKSHGGPTAATDNRFDAAIQFWTTRGFAVADVNYGGSTGYGRDYRELLHGAWGIVDVEDCAAAARHLVERGEVDPQRLAIRGGSAGGYTTLAALAFTDVFHVGASHYGVGDLETLARDTHKFESRYLDGLVGPYPERTDLYRQRSPLHAAERIRCPVIFFQGTDDKVVPPNQAEEMVAALRGSGVRVRYVPFEGEGHGFRRAENIARALEEELAFYREVLRLGQDSG